MSFKFSLEELKKINILLPKGFKFVTREESQRKDTQRAAPRKKTIAPMVSEVSSVHSRPKNEKE